MDVVRRILHIVPENEERPFLPPCGCSEKSTAAAGTMAAADYQPAFFDPRSGTVYISRFADGTPAPLHVLGGLPRELFATVEGNRLGLRNDVIAGFACGRRFHSRAEAVGLRESGGAAPHRIVKRLVFL